MWLCNLSRRIFEDTFKNTHRRKVKQMQTVWLCMLWSKFFEDTFENTQWRKTEQMQPMQLCILSDRRFEETFENPHWRKLNKCNEYVWPLGEKRLWCIWKRSPLIIKYFENTHHMKICMLCMWMLNLDFFKQMHCSHFFMQFFWAVQICMVSHDTICDWSRSLGHNWIRINY